MPQAQQENLQEVIEEIIHVNQAQRKLEALVQKEKSNLFNGRNGFTLATIFLV